MAVLEMCDPDQDSRHSRLDQLLSEFSISHLRAAPSVSLSGGSDVALKLHGLSLVTVVHSFDEPLAGIDPIAVAETWQLGSI